MLTMPRFQSAFCLVLATSLSLVTSLEPVKQESFPKVVNAIQRMINVTEAVNGSTTRDQPFSTATSQTLIDVYILIYSDITDSAGTFSPLQYIPCNTEYSNGIFTIYTSSADFNNYLNSVSISADPDLAGFTVSIDSPMAELSYQTNFRNNRIFCKRNKETEGSNTLDVNFCGIASGLSTQFGTVSACIKLGAAVSGKNVIDPTTGITMKNIVVGAGIDIGCYWANSTNLVWTDNKGNGLQSMLLHTVNACSHTATNSYLSFLIAACLALFFRR